MKRRLILTAAFYCLWAVRGDLGTLLTPPRASQAALPAAAPLAVAVAPQPDTTAGAVPAAAPDPSAITDSQPPATSAPTQPTTGETTEAVRAVDGDTLELADGRRVRMIGIDTPEEGDCGYQEAGDHLAALIGGKTVTLLPGATADQDRYGRLLRYVEIDGTDVNLAMIASGRAVARYDSLDGYGPHPREAAYRAADDASPSANICS